jgi:hypothetical protein
MTTRLKTIQEHDVKAHTACRNGSCHHVKGYTVGTFSRETKHRPGASRQKWFKPAHHISYKGEQWGAGEVRSRRERILRGRTRLHSYATVSRELLNLVEVSTDRKTIEVAWEDYRWLRGLHEEGRLRE